MKRFIVMLAIGAAWCLLSAPLEAGCPSSVLIYHHAQPGEGAIDLSGTQYADKGMPGPNMRFWAFDHFATANSGKQDQHVKGVEWLMHLPIDLANKDIPKGYWHMVGTDWFGLNIDGCPLSYDDKHSVFEFSFVDDRMEKTAQHKGYYAVAGVPFEATWGGYNMDLVQGAEGPKGNVLPVRPIPPPEPDAPQGKVNAKDNGFMDVTLKLGEVASYSDQGKNKPNLIAGYRLYFKNDQEPNSSDPGAYEEVRNPENPDKALGVVPFGAAKAAVSVPMPKDAVWFVARVQYADATAEVLSQATSAHGAKVASPKGKTVDRRSK